ncbi:GNAT family N-acetyltransferase [Phenylobacterium sp.]|uniref:GNAT family N-acetyltransferase n=1 Tax=Phenylobacterium sp. TaxID=1871053 RepID=UPI002E2EB376|nr:GNAT family N-acetyltransferase [Phenylobacterium sp.]HEX2559007.1 GNAT family N-acetyltransferase [Phenylobacterium sp.]
MIETERLILRAPEDADRAAIAAMNADPRVAATLGSALTREESDAMVDRIRVHIGLNGWGFWAVERKADQAVIGLTGLLSMGEDLPPGPAVEIGWRLAHEAWGGGYATEAAAAALAWGFEHIRPAEIIAITARSNLRSQAVMSRIGMVPDPARDFDHPKLATDHPLRPHVTYVAKA